MCNGVSYGVRPIVACLPAWWRFAQCLRRYRDTRLVFPHLVNAGKYSTTFFVVVFSSLNNAYKGDKSLRGGLLLIVYGGGIFPGGEGVINLVLKCPKVFFLGNPEG